ncbi:hypothetical protein QYM36_001557 [Artemia franciscana]|uniref:Guanine nucleotide exchange factor MSS4 n=2 Tax=Artemia franciscana TaxID=6661 RepID=A0AA88IJZ9_ARTSF|nr:hypothetical protein QYM36_001557 [Artemia franciscana]
MANDSKDYAKAIFCQKCPSKILAEGFGQHHIQEVSLPKLTLKKDTNEVETEDVSEFVAVKNIYDFENVGFSNTVESKKYLICADCESGPIGWHCTETKISYIALSRVKQ